MPNLTAIHNLAANTEFLARFAAAIAAYVPIVSAEDPLTPNHAVRLAQAARAVRRPAHYAAELALAAAAACDGVMPADEVLMGLVAQYWSLVATDLAEVP